MLNRRAFIRNTTEVAAIGVIGNPAAHGASAASIAERVIALSDLAIDLTRQGWSQPERNCRLKGKPLTIGHRQFKSGLGTVADSILQINLKGVAKEFSAWVGPDAVGGPSACVRFYVVVDGKIAAQTPVMAGGAAPVHIFANLQGAKDMLLVVDAAGYHTWSNYADWGDAAITLQPNATALPESQRYEPDMSVPDLARDNFEQPEIHGPQAIGTTPEKPFIFKIPVTGAGKINLSVTGLPAGLELDQQGVLRGSVGQAGSYKVEIIARNNVGRTSRRLEIRAGERMLAQTPPIGWSSWNAFGVDVDQEKIWKTADALVQSGLADKGYSFINIDAGWTGQRNTAGRIMPDKNKFPDIKALIDHVHSLALKFGLYASPGPVDCGGCIGSYGHEIQDIHTYAQWGVDYFKYDWCSYGQTITAAPTTIEYIEPYAVMGQAIGTVERDIVFSLCQYGMADPWKWAAGPQVRGNLWRISDDLIDFWASVCINGFHCDRRIAAYAGPGRWNDPDMLVVGTVNFTNASLGFPGKPQASRLTPIEQQTHISLWSLLAAPLIIGCDLTKLDQFTMDLLSNPEVIAVDQDILGKQAQCIKQAGHIQVWARPLADGTAAVGIFNLGPVTEKASVRWSELTVILPRDIVLSGKQPIRDLWKRHDLGRRDGLDMELPSHGAMIVKVGRPRSAVGV
ncbi:MAG: NPCBM/NEW2 domain-containing protein [Phycisphaerae bacterium]